MNNFFESKSIAIIGASKNPKKLGNQLLKNLVKSGFVGKIYPINLEEKEILKLKAYQSVLDVHAKIDFACIIVPREVVPEVLMQCVHKEIPSVLIISAGFSEKDSIGKSLEKKLLEITKGTKTRIIGPNCLGIVNTGKNLNLTFAAGKIIEGKIDLVLQSGAIGAAIFDWASENNIGINKFISLGNKVHFDEVDALQLLEDDSSNVIALYLEQISDPKRFLEVSRRITKRKPVIILKGGLTLAGAKAAASHTAALSGPEEINEALFEQSNLLVAEDLEELLNFLRIYQKEKLEMLNENLAVVTNAGGPGILSVDAASQSGLNVPVLENFQKREISRRLEKYASIDNPIDLGGDATKESYEVAIKYFQNQANIAAILAIVTPQTMTDIKGIARIITKHSETKKHLLALFLGGTKIHPSIEMFRKSHIPFYDDPAEAVRLLAKMYRYKSRIKEESKIEIESKNVFSGLTDEEIIKHYQIPFAKSISVQNDAEVMGHIEEIGYPVAFKSLKETQRGKKGKVGLNIGDHDSLVRAIERIGYPAILQKMVDSPFEIFVGAKRDEMFGIILLFGQGGIFVENLDDISRKMLPLTDVDLNEMIETTKIWPVIKEFKVKETIKQLLLVVARIMLENKDIAEIEINPLKVMPKKLIGVDINTIRKNI